jgi:predicted RNA polymerase sigma factor
LPKATLETAAEHESGRREFGRQDDRLHHSLDRIALTRALEALPSGYRTIFELHEISGYGHREIARLLHCSVGNSKSQLHKAKQRIRECLISKRHFAHHLRRSVKEQRTTDEVRCLGKNTTKSDLGVEQLIRSVHGGLAEGTA